MSDSYEGRDYKYDEDSGGRRRKRRSRQMRYDDDAWGMANAGDMSDGARADIEDWAAGMVDEESRRYREQRRNRRDQESMGFDDDLGDIDRPELSRGSSIGASRGGQYRGTVRRSDGRYDDLGESSALSRADRLRERFNRGQGRGYVEGTDRPAIYEDDKRKAKPKGSGSGDFFDALFDFKVDSLPETISSVAVIAIIAILLISVACIGAAWLTAEELVRILQLK